jgi:hypothetical protein
MVLDDGGSISRAWENIRENTKISAQQNVCYELKYHKPWIDEECSLSLDERKQAKLQWFEDPSQGNREKLNHIKFDTSIHIKKKTGVVGDR